MNSRLLTGDGHSAPALVFESGDAVMAVLKEFVREKQIRAAGRLDHYCFRPQRSATRARMTNTQAGRELRSTDDLDSR